MMKRLFLILIMAVCFNANANTWVDATINSVRSFTTQTNQYVMVSNFSNPDKCTYPGTVAIVRDDNNNWKMVHSNLLAGFLAGKSIRLRVSGCESTGYPIVNGVEVLKD